MCSLCSLFYFLLPLFFLRFLFKWLFIHQREAPKNPPPSPPGLPVIGNLHQLGLNPHRALYSLAQKHGELMLLHLGNVPVLIISSSAAAREIMKTHDHIFLNRPKSSITSGLFYDALDVAFCPYGEYWRQVRSICVLNLLSSRKVKSFQKVREEETGLMVAKIRESCSLSSPSPPVCLSDIFASLARDVLSRVTLGRKYGGTGDRRDFKKMIRTASELLGAFDVGDYIPWLAWLSRINGLYHRVEKVAKELDEFLESEVEERRNAIENWENKGEGGGLGESQHSLVDVLLQIQRDSRAAGSPVHANTLKAVILDMLVAGIETTQVVLDWTMTELLRHPRIMKKLQDEVRGIGRDQPSITEDDLNNMNYLKMVTKEILRLHAPAPLLLPRESTKAARVMGKDIEAGTQVYINIWAIGRDPSLWEDPGEFRPERFFNTDVDFRGKHFELLPFGAGRRGCPGDQFATSVIELALANLVYKFDFSLPGGASGDSLDLEEASGIPVHKKNPLVVVASPHA